MTFTPEVKNMDCMEAMKGFPDKFFDLAICDPPYGINAGLRRGDTGKNGHIKQKDLGLRDRQRLL